MRTIIEDTRSHRSRRRSTDIDLPTYRHWLARSFQPHPMGEWIEGAVEDDFHGEQRVLAALAALHGMEREVMAENLADAIRNAERVNRSRAGMPTL